MRYAGRHLSFHINIASESSRPFHSKGSIIGRHLAGPIALGAIDRFIPVTARAIDFVETMASGDIWIIVRDSSETVTVRTLEIASPFARGAVHGQRKPHGHGCRNPKYGFSIGGARLVGNRFRAILRLVDPDAVTLVQLVRLPLGGLQDDVGVILVRGMATSYRRLSKETNRLKCNF